MCYSPVFCWILSTVLENAMKVTPTEDLPRTLTQMYIHFLVVQVKVKNLKYDDCSETDSPWTPENRKMVNILEKLAFKQLQKGKLIFYDSDLDECGLDAAKIAQYSGVFTQVFREEPGQTLDKVYCFIHLTVQEFLAALHVHQTFFDDGVDLLSNLPKLKKPDAHFYRSAVDQALQSPNGHLDLLLRFLLGLSLPTNQNLLQGLLMHLLNNTAAQMEPSLQKSLTVQQTVQYIERKINECQSAERIVNLFYCLYELNDHSLVEKIQRNIREKHLRPQDMSNALWSAVAFLLLSSDLEEFDLKKYYPSEEIFLKLLRVAEASKQALLSECNLTERCCGPLSSVLSSDSCSLTVLDLSKNPIKDSGVKQLCKGLENTPSRLETLSLQDCKLSEESCRPLGLVLRSRSSSLKNLNLSENPVKDTGVKHLTSGLEVSHCALQTLKLSKCDVSDDGAALLDSVVKSGSSRLKELDLTDNKINPNSEHIRSLQKHLNTLRVGIPKEKLKKYYCMMFLDPDTAHTSIRVSDDRRQAQYELVRGFFSCGNPHPERFKHCTQVLCSTALTGRCFWEVEYSGDVDIAVSYKGIARKGYYAFLWRRGFGADSLSWCLRLSAMNISVIHNGTETPVDYWVDLGLPKRLAVFLDHSGGTISFFRVYGEDLILLHRFSATFTEPLYAGFRLSWRSSVSLV